MTRSLYRLSLLFAFTCIQSAYSGEENKRYRGQYTYSHEVNIFCPEISSRCYWLSGDTNREARYALKRLVTENTGKPYESVCVVLEGQFDRRPDEAKIPALAADYDGLISVSHVFDLCHETELVTQGDLQHHRWVLESIDGIEIDMSWLPGGIPELDFGEAMFVSVHSGCNRYSGKAVLDNEQISLEILQSSVESCSPEQESLEKTVLSVLHQEPSIRITDKKNLLLKSDSVLLKYRLKDWVR